MNNFCSGLKPQASSLIIVFLFAILSSTHAVRIKDIATFQGVRDNQLQGVGLVVGLAGTGDSQTIDFTRQAVVSYLRRQNITVDIDGAETENAALVLVTATLPPFAKLGSNVNVTLSAMGDAESLQGGTLLQTPLRAANGDIYAVAQGPLVLGGFAAGGGGNSVTQNHPTVAMIPNGGIVEREVPFALQNSSSLTLVLQNPDHTTASRTAEVINTTFGPISHANDLSSITITVPPDRMCEKLVGFISEVERLPVHPDVKARVVINERTGTIVMGEGVRISTVAIAKGNLTIETSTLLTVSQPEAFSERGRTVVVPETDISAQESMATTGVVPGGEKPANVGILEEGVSIGEVVGALNAIGATPRDLIAILQAIKDAGALQAELVVEQ